MSNLKEILLFTSYGGDAMTSEMKKILQKRDYPENRFGEIVDYIKNKAILMENKSEEDFEDIKNFLKNSENIVKVVENKNEVYILWDKDLSYISSFSIREVDISRPWTISEYDGSESIKYLDDYKCSNKELNFYKRN